MPDPARSRERPIIFSAPMVRAILDGRKTQTRRVLKPPRDGSSWYRHPETGAIINSMGGPLPRLPYAPGDRLWVRESWQQWPPNNTLSEPERPLIYKATTLVEPNPPEWATHWGGKFRWRSPIHMPRWASRITLDVTDVRVQRLQEISEEDAKAEGALLSDAGGVLCYRGRDDMPVTPSAAVAFRDLWSSIHGPGSWEVNPWVAAITFRRVDTPARSVEAR